MNKLNDMDYSEFTEYLKAKSIGYEEACDLDTEVYFTEYIEVIPNSRKLKSRSFSLDGGWQLIQN